MWDTSLQHRGESMPCFCRRTQTVGLPCQRRRLLPMRLPWSRNDKSRRRYNRSGGGPATRPVGNDDCLDDGTCGGDALVLALASGALFG